MDNNPQTLVGQTLKGYELKELIGSGGFGSVYRAWYPLLRREVAVKIILPEYANEENFIRRFETEAQVVARLEHLHIVPLYDFWREPDSACLVMRWLRGGSLEAAIDNHGSWPLEDAARLIDQIAAALAVAHRNGIVHRDLKPANILLDDEKNAYLADFGIAKNILVDQEITDEDRFGSPEYISPEQVMGQPVSPQTDIYSLGVVLYMMLTGRTPFSESTTTAVIRRHLSDTLPPLQTTHPDLPHGLNAVIWKATSKRPEQRYPDSLTMAADVRRVVGGQTTIGTMATRVGMSPQVILSSVGQTIPIDIPLEPENPYKGLRAFQEADQSDFYGRKKLVEQLLGRLSEPGPLNRFLAVIGPSGSGKSSVVKAGLLPAIRRGTLHQSDEWFITQMTPGAAPFQQLADALLKVAKSALDNLRESLRSSPEMLAKHAESIAPAGLLLFIDQFEELFTLTADVEERRAFIESIIHAVTTGQGGLRLILTLRADYYDRPLLYPLLGELLRERTVVVLPLSSAETEAAITGPAERYGLRFEPGLVSAIVSDVGNLHGGLPLLQFALTELFEQRSGYVLTHDGYEASGGVLRSLGRRAEEIFQAFDVKQQGMTRQLFLQLVSSRDEREDVRNRIRRSRLVELAGHDRDTLDLVLEVFTRSRLLTLDYELQSRAPVVEVAHEALFRVWDRLKAWVETAQADLRLYHQLEIAAGEWTQSGRDGAFLARGARLSQFEAAVESPILPLSEQQQSYLLAATRSRRRARQRAFVGIIGLTIITAIATGLALFAFDRQSLAEREREAAARQLQLSQARELSTNALMVVDSQPDLALLLSLASLNAVDTYEGRNSLLVTLQAYPQLSRFFQGTSSPINTLDLSPDGNSIVTGHDNGEIVIWNRATGRPERDAVSAHQGAIQRVVFSPDGTQIASSGNDQRVTLWDIESGALIAEFLGHESSVRGLDYSPDGDLVASADDAGLILVHDVISNELIVRLTDAEGVSFSVLVFSPDGQYIAAAGDDNRIWLWTTNDWQLAGDPLEGHTNWVRDLKFLPVDDSLILASGSSDGRVVFRDISTGEILQVIATNHTVGSGVWRLTFSPDAALMMTVSQDQTAQLWEVSSGLPVGEPFTAHTDDVRDVIFSPDGQMILTAGRDSSLLEWTLSTPNVLAVPVPFGLVDVSNPPPILTVTFNHDGSLAAASGGNFQSADGSYAITIWDIPSGQIVQTLPGHVEDVVDIEFARDNTRLISRSKDQTIQVWEIATGTVDLTLDLRTLTPGVPMALSPDSSHLVAGTLTGEIAVWGLSSGTPSENTLRGHSQEVNDLAFSPDGLLLASASLDGTIRLWNTADWQLIRILDAFDAPYTALTFAPDGRTLVSGDEQGRVRLWDLTTGLPDERQISLSGEVTSLSISGDGLTLGTAVFGDDIRLWDMATLSPLGERLTGHSDVATKAMISRDGRYLISGGADRQVFLWSIALDAWQALACSIANRNLTEQEMERYPSLAPYQPDCSSDLA
jgi:WD40 repeat protein/serine/threonine protein kinase